jgi:hypothetical protein
MSLQVLSNDQLVTNLKNLRSRENELLIELLEHIQEVERRSLHLQLGYPSMYAYLTKEMGYSEHEAYTRIETARFLSQVPQTRDDIASGQLTMSAVTEIRSAIKEIERRTGRKITPDIKADLAEDMRGCSRRDVQRKLSDKLEVSQHIVTEKLKPFRNGQWLLELILNSDQKFGLERARDILAHAGPMTGFSEVVERLTQHFLKKKDLTLMTPHFFPGEETLRNTQEPAKRIGVSLRRAVFRRDRGQCQFLSPDGSICASTYEVELDHILPVSKGGRNTYANLRCMCRAHNHYMRNKIYTGVTTNLSLPSSLRNIP